MNRREFFRIFRGFDYTKTFWTGCGWSKKEWLAQHLTEAEAIEKCVKMHMDGLASSTERVEI